MSLSLSHWYTGSGVVLDCIDSRSLHPYLLLKSNIVFTSGHRPVNVRRVMTGSKG